MTLIAAEVLYCIVSDKAQTSTSTTHQQSATAQKQDSDQMNLVEDFSVF